MPWHKLIPVLVSILIIVAVAIAREYSRPLAAITATMPLAIPLSLWIAWAAEHGSRSAMSSLSGAMLISLLPTLLFALVAWLALRAGWRLLPTLALGYAVWGLATAAVFGIRALLHL